MGDKIVTVLNYDDLADEYERHRRVYPGLIEHIVGYAGITRDCAVLEVGCGTANHLAAVCHATDARGTGVDPSREMLQRAARHPERLDLRIGRAEELGVAPAAFDLVMSVDMIHYVREPRRYFDRAFRALKPGGFVVTVTDSDWVIRNRMPVARYFPATIEAEANRYHPVPALAGAMALAGFGSLNERLIESEYQLTDAARFKEKAYSCLHLISEEDFAKGVTALEADLAQGPIQANLRSLALWGRRPGD